MLCFYVIRQITHWFNCYNTSSICTHNDSPLESIEYINSHHIHRRDIRTSTINVPIENILSNNIDNLQRSPSFIISSTDVVASIDASSELSTDTLTHVQLYDFLSVDPSEYLGNLRANISGQPYIFSQQRTISRYHSNENYTNSTDNNVDDNTDMESNITLLGSPLQTYAISIVHNASSNVFTDNNYLNNKRISIWKSKNDLCNITMIPNSCGICFDKLLTMDNNDDNDNDNDNEHQPVYVAKKKCKHYFHYTCIESWINKHNGCPLCKKNSINIGYH
jgi:hypothetical protein